MADDPSNADLQRIAATQPLLRHLAARIPLSESAYRRALETAGLVPTSEQWGGLLSRFLLFSGSAFLVLGIALFFAHNWAELHRFAKLGVLQIALLGAVAAAWRKGMDTPIGRAALLTAAALTGVLLAVYGQIYQTGADSYGLFIVWAGLILGWALIGRQPTLWLMMIILLNLALILYWEQVLEPPDNLGAELSRTLGPGVWLLLMVSDFTLAQVVFALNATSLVAWEALSAHGVHWAQGRWVPRVLACLSLATIVATSLMLIFVGESVGARGVDFAAPLWLAVFVAVALWFYRFRHHDLSILTLSLLAIIVLITASVARLAGDGIEIALLLAFLVVAQTGIAALWLRRVAKEWGAW